MEAQACNCPIEPALPRANFSAPDRAHDPTDMRAVKAHQFLYKLLHMQRIYNFYNRGRRMMDVDLAACQDHARLLHEIVSTPERILPCDPTSSATSGTHDCSI